MRGVLKRVRAARRRWFGGCVVLCVAMIAGCGDSGPERLPLSGTVRLDGEPVDDATIVLNPKTQGPAAVALITGGEFQFSKLDGPAVGSYDVRISPNEAEMQEVAVDPEVLKTQSGGIPTAYQRGGILTVEISGDLEQRIELELDSSRR